MIVPSFVYVKGYSSHRLYVSKDKLLLGFSVTSGDELDELVVLVKDILRDKTIGILKEFLEIE